MEFWLRRPGMEYRFGYMTSLIISVITISNKVFGIDKNKISIEIVNVQNYILPGDKLAVRTQVDMVKVLFHSSVMTQ